MEMHELNTGMDQHDTIFIKLFRQACAKCFGTPLAQPLTETDSKVLSNTIFEATGLSIGVKSLKNYSLYVVSPTAEHKENPSTATLDTLARYVMGAPYTSEVARKNDESHHPYWHQYRKANAESASATPMRKPKRVIGAVALCALIVVAAFLIRKSLAKETTPADFTDPFNDVSLVSLQQRGWELVNGDTLAWKNSGDNPGHLTLNTDYGDNWSDAQTSSSLKNVLVREIADQNFAAEIHLTEFIPENNWQQAGIILSENKSFSGKVVRLSISYNDFFGGFKKEPEIIVQGLSSSESGSNSKPEEFTHFEIFTVDVAQQELVKKNLSHSSLKIEKNGNRFRFLYAVGPVETFAFKEITTREFSIEPKYIGLFATQGLATDGRFMPVKFDSFKYLH
jgi:hypothetical protein